MSAGTSTPSTSPSSGPLPPLPEEGQTIVPSGNCQQDDGTERWLAYGIGLLMASFVVVRAFTSLPDYDGPYNAILPKNLVMGQGYKTTYPAHQGYTVRDGEDQDRFFNAESTTGPALLFPAGLLMWAFGARYWIPGLTTALLSVALAAGSVLLVARLYGLQRRSRAVFAFSWVLLLLYLTHDLFWPGVDSGFLRNWFELVGDVPSGLLTVLAAVYLMASASGRWRPLVGGLLLGLSYLIKSLSLIGGLVILVGFAARHLWAGRRVTRTLLATAVLALGFAAPIALYGVFKRVHVANPTLLHEQAEAERNLFVAVGSGLLQFDQAKDKTAFFASSIKRHAHVLGTAFPWPVVLLLVGMMPAAAWVVLSPGARVRPELRSAAWLSFVLLAAFAAHAAWWILFEYQGWMRRMIQSLIYFAGGLSLLLSVLPTHRGSRLAVLAIALVGGHPVFHLLVVFPRFLHKDAELKAAQETAAFLEGEQAKGAVLLGCGWAANRELEYMMPGSRNFFDCLSIPPRGWGRRTLLVRGRYWDLVASDTRARIQQNCERHVLLSRPPFTVSECEPAFVQETMYMRPGFYDPEPWGRWTSKRAILYLTESQRRRGITLSLRVGHPDVAARGVNAQLSVERRVVASVRFSSAEAVRLELTPEQLGGGQALELTVDRTWNPRALGLSDDVRDLGLGVTVLDGSLANPPPPRRAESPQ